MAVYLNVNKKYVRKNVLVYQSLVVEKKKKLSLFRICSLNYAFVIYPSCGCLRIFAL